MQPITGKVNSHMERDKLRQCKDIYIIDWLIVIMWWHGFVSAYHIWPTVCVVRYQRCSNAINNTLNGTNKSRCHHHHHDCGLCDCDMIVVLLSCLCGFVFSCAFLLVVVVVVLFHMTARRCVCDDDWLCWRPWVCLATFQLRLSLSAARLASSSSSSPPPPWSSSSSLPSSSWFRLWVDSTHTCMVWWQWLWLCACVCDFYEFVGGCLWFLNNERGRARDIQDCIGTNCMAFHMSLISSGIGASFYYSLGHWPSGLHRLLVDNISNIVDRSILELVLEKSCRNVGSKSGSEGSHETFAFSQSFSQSDTRIFIKTISDFFQKFVNFYWYLQNDFSLSCDNWGCTLTLHVAISMPPDRARCRESFRQRLIRFEPSTEI